MIVLALESSTSSAKAILYDTACGVRAVKTIPYPQAACAGGVSDTDAIAALTLQAGAEIAAGQPVQAVAVCGTWHSIGLCEGSLSKPGKTYSWNYLAPSAQCAAIRQDKTLTDTLYQRTGCMPHVTYSRHALRWLSSQGAELSRMQFISQGAYTFYRLTGEYRESISTMSGGGLINIHKLTYDDFVLQWLNIRPEQLAPLATFRDTAGLTQQAADLLSIAPGIPVVPAFPDGALNQLAAGALEHGRMTLSIGTSSAIRLSVPEPKLPENHALWCYYGVDGWVSGAAISGACNCVNWFMERALGRKLSFDELEQGDWNLEDLPVFLPFLFGERCPGWNDARRGGFLGVLPEHGPKELYRGLLAGILCNLYQCYETLCACSQEPLDIRVSDGVLHSPQWTQMLADFLQRELLCANEPDASTIGAALLAAHAAGDPAPLGQGSNTSMHRVRPRASQAEACRSLYERYRSAYLSGL